ncbi:hypothetical protein [Bradyrhizobium sp. 62]|uniref:hypothetical protein n=1 Tax=Bradyrhizobium sp. 62 TaxID=1043588 RepID=UPI001FF834C0|nr:hypothetical protein [Bradyrhizobium sp. 62]MCK1363630.1 hypothetical protein [Bradyrhizobium sp. 62]
MSVLLTTALTAAQRRKLGLSSGHVLILSLQFNDTRLLRRKLPLPLDNLAFDLPQSV